MSKTKNLLELLAFFNAPDQNDMRTFISPEKELNPNNVVELKSKQLQKELNQTFEKSVSEPRAMPASSALTTNQQYNPYYLKNNTTTSESEKSSNKEGLSVFKGEKYKPHEKHHFIPILYSSFVGNTSPDRKYSEISFILWLDGKSLQKYQYSSPDKYRIIINMIYDAEDDLWNISAKMFKRPSYSLKDDEENQVNNRLCLTNELRSEIKRILLFFGVSPRQAYRLFRKNIQEYISFSRLDGGFYSVECASHSARMQELNKPLSSSSTTTTTYNNNYDRHRIYDEYHGYSRHTGHHHLGKQKDNFSKYEQFCG